jgi:predicted metal-dependent phosphoesterase TrpH
MKNQIKYILTAIAAGSIGLLILLLIMKREWKADLHMHTTHSDGKLNPLQVVDLTTAMKFDVIAITDHNRVDGAYIARDYASKIPGAPIVIIGEEVTPTSSGQHILALGIYDTIPPNLSDEETCRLIHKQRGIAIIAHPGKGNINTGWGDLPREVFESSIVFADGAEFNSLSVDFWKKRGGDFCIIADSDAHKWEHFGLAYTFYKSKEVLNAIKNQNISRLCFNYGDVCMNYGEW